MTDKDLRNEWAWSQVEGHADGSLEGVALERMQAALRNDPQLRAAVGRAGAVRAALRRARAVPLPAGLRAKLLRIPGPALPRWTTLAAATTAAAPVVGGLWLAREPAPQPPDPRVAALEEFNVAMKYVRKSAAITSKEVTDRVGGGLRDALAVGGNALRDADARKKQTGG
jgi:hypothetical protein